MPRRRGGPDRAEDEIARFGHRLWPRYTGGELMSPRPGGQTQTIAAATFPGQAPVLLVELLLVELLLVELLLVERRVDIARRGASWLVAISGGDGS